VTIIINLDSATMGKGVLVTEDEHRAWEYLHDLTDPWKPGTRISIEINS
jgi:hypothetical protein